MIEQLWWLTQTHHTQEGTLLIGPLLACNVIQGITIGYREEFQTFAPMVPEERMADAFYSWIPPLFEKMKKDLVSAGVWERACVVSIHLASGVCGSKHDRVLSALFTIVLRPLNP